jgi:hypothetical protein
MPAKKAVKKEAPKTNITISPPNFKVMEFNITGTAPFVQHKFSSRIQEEIEGIQREGSTAKSKKKREPKDFEKLYEEAMHKFPDGSHGIPAGSFRNAMVDVCRAANFVMTKAKQTIFIVADGYSEEGTPLVKFTKGKPKMLKNVVRLANGSMDIRSRPMWDPGWKMKVRVRFDADIFTMQDVANLMERAGLQVGVGEGRPFSKNSCGQGWGTFTTAEQ